MHAAPSVTTKPNRMRAIASHPVVAQLSWIVGPFGFLQVVRLVTQIVLARLLAPEMFGLMLLVNTLRTGAELLSDIGIGQSVVRSQNGDDPVFLNVAFTVQVVRGLFLTALMAALAYPMASLYDEPQLLIIMLAVSPIFLISGLRSPALFIVQRHIRLRARAKYDVVTVVFQCAFTIVLAWYLENVWALVLGLVVSTAFSTLLSFFVARGYQPRLSWRKDHFLEIFHFGKWIFLGTALYFVATSFDRLYFVAALSLSLAGVYGIARTFSELLSALAQRIGNQLVFPKVAALQDRRAELAPRLRKARAQALVSIAVLAGVGVAGSDAFILFAYDARYHAAAIMIPILLIAVWFGMLSFFSESMLLGCSRPIPGAIANGAKFAVLLVGLPLSIAAGDFMYALGVIVLSEIARWLAIAPAARSEGFARIRDDVLLTFLMLAVAIVAKTVLSWTEFVPSILEWWSFRGLLDE